MGMFGHFCSLDNVLVIIFVQTRLWGGFVLFRSVTEWPCLALALCEIVYIQQDYRGLAVSARPASDVRGSFSFSQLLVFLRASEAESLLSISL